jgi:NadR type nicotinamide-nucleotide adenylyltransferase
MIRGLIVGKFAPLHRGHVLLATSALSCCDELSILSYTSQKFDRCDAVRRRRWLHCNFPTARVVVLDDHGPIPGDAAPDDVHRAFIAALLNELHFIPHRVFTSEAYGFGFADCLARAFSRSVEHISIDSGRVRIPVSATAIRADVHAQRHWLAPSVYADFVQRIAMLGAESTGKSTLSRWLAHIRSTHCVAEYGREVWESKAGALTFTDLLLIAQG